MSNQDKLRKQVDELHKSVLRLASALGLTLNYNTGEIIVSSPKVASDELLSATDEALFQVIEVIYSGRELQIDLNRLNQDLDT